MLLLLLPEFLIRLQNECKALSEEPVSILIPFEVSYLGESGFSTVAGIKSKN